MDNKKKITRYLGKEGRSPTSKIAIMLGRNYYEVQKLLKQLRREGLVLSEKKGKGVYWILK